MNPDAPLYYRAFKRGDVEAVDRLVELSHGHRDVVKTDEDWRVLEELIKFYVYRWPDEWKQFKATVPEIRETRRAGGYSQSKEIKYMGALPPRLERLIKRIFPMQQYDKKFTTKLFNKFTVFKVGGEGN